MHEGGVGVHPLGEINKMVLEKWLWKQGQLMKEFSDPEMHASRDQVANSSAKPEMLWLWEGCLQFM